MKRGEISFISRLLQSKLFFIILMCLVVISGIRLSNEIARRVAITKQINALKNQVEKLRTDRDSLSYLMKSLSSDSFIEDAARNKLNLAKPGEQVVVIPTPAQQEKDTKTRPQEQQAPLMWWSYFFGENER